MSVFIKESAGVDASGGLEGRLFARQFFGESEESFEGNTGAIGEGRVHFDGRFNRCLTTDAAA